MPITGHRVARSVTAVALLVLLVGVGGLASSAPAHHAKLPARHAKLSVGGPKCVVKNGQAYWRINYTTSSWSPGTFKGSHKDIEIWWDEARIGTSQSTGSWLWQATRAVDGLTFTLSKASRSGTFLVPGHLSGTTIWVGAYANGPWTDGGWGHQLWGTGATGLFRNRGVALPKATCAPPGQPGATAEVVCAGGHVRFRLTNTGGSATQLDILVDGINRANNVNVPAGTTAGNPVVVDITFAVLGLDENESLPYVVELQNGNDVATGTLTRDCDAPADPDASAERICAPGGGGTLRVTLTNGGGEPVTFDVDGTPHVVGPGGEEVVDVPADEDETLTVVVTAPGMATRTFTETFDCTNPQFGAVVCATSSGTAGVWVTLTNDGDLATVVTLSAPPPAGGITPNPVGVPAGGSSVVFVAQAEGAPGFTLTGTSAGNAAITVAVPARDCLRPVPTIAADDECAAEGVAVILGNEEGTDDAVFTVTDDGTPVGAPITVLPGQTVTVTVPVAEGDTYSIAATVVGGYPVTGGPVEGTRDCQEPVLVAVYECAEGGVLVRIGNGGELPVEVTVPGAVVPTQTVDPGIPVDFLIPQDEGGPGATVTVATGDGNEPLTVTYGERDCVSPEVPAITHQCGDHEVVFTLGNTDGVLPATFTVTVTDDGADVPVDGVDDDGEVTVPAGQTVQLTFPVSENHTYTVSVSEAAQGDFPDQVIVVDCLAAPDPQAAVEKICATDGSGGTLRVTLANDNDEDGESVTFTVEGPDGEETYTLEGGDVRVVDLDADENETVTVTVTAPGFSETFTEELDCAEPEVVVTLAGECAPTGVRITLTNEGLDSGAYVVSNDGAPVPGLSGVVPATDVVDIVVPVAEGQAYSITVTVDGEPVGDPLTGTRNCEIELVRVEVSAICDSDTPGLRWSIELDSPLPATGVTLELLDADGHVVVRHTGLGLTGELLWPGVVVDADGAAIDWPGWILQGGTWVQADDGFLWARPTLGIRFLVNPTSPDVTLAYPEPSPTCNAGPSAATLGDRSPTTPTGTDPGATAGATSLPRTGVSATGLLLLALALTLAGFGLTIVATGRRRTARTISREATD